MVLIGYVVNAQQTMNPTPKSPKVVHTTPKQANAPAATRSVHQPAPKMVRSNQIKTTNQTKASNPNVVKSKPLSQQTRNHTTTK